MEGRCVSAGDREWDWWVCRDRMRDGKKKSDVWDRERDGGSDTYKSIANWEYEHQVYLHSAKVHCWFSWDDQTLLSCVHSFSLFISSVFSSLALSNHPFLFLSLPPFPYPLDPCFYGCQAYYRTQDGILQNSDLFAEGWKCPEETPEANIFCVFDPIRIQVFFPIIRHVVHGRIWKCKIESLSFSSIWLSFDPTVFPQLKTKLLIICVYHSSLCYWYMMLLMSFSQARWQDWSVHTEISQQLLEGLNGIWCKHSWLPEDKL